MLRRLLACLAFLTGLSAVGMPAHANTLEALGASLELHQKAEQPGKSAPAACPDTPAQPKLGGEKLRKCRPPTVTVLIPTVMLGADRATE